MDLILIPIKDQFLLNVIMPLFIEFIFFQAEDGIRDPLWSRGLGDVYKRQVMVSTGRKEDD